MEKRKELNTVYYYRDTGRKYCNTEGSEHYISKEIEPIDVAIVNNMFEDFALTNIVKYAIRFKDTRNPDDLKKVADYAHILCGVELTKEGDRKSVV